MINCGHVATTYLTYQFPILAKSILNEKYYNELVAGMIERNTLDTNLDHEWKTPKKKTFTPLKETTFIK